MRRLIWIAVAALLLTSTPVLASLTRTSGPQPTGITTKQSLPSYDVAYDSIHDVYLVVKVDNLDTGVASTPQKVQGRLIGSGGATATDFDISSHIGSAGPRVVFDRDHGRFLVVFVYHAIVGAEGGPRHDYSLMARSVTIEAGAPVLGPEVFLNVAGSYQFLGFLDARVAYSAPSRAFIVSSHRLASDSGGATLATTVIDASTFAVSQGFSTTYTTISHSVGLREISCDVQTPTCLLVRWDESSSRDQMLGRFVDSRTGLAIGPADVSLVGPVSSLSLPAVVYVPETTGVPAHYLAGVISSGTLTGVIADARSQTFGAPFAMLTVPAGWNGVSFLYSPSSGSIVSAIDKGGCCGAPQFIVQEFDNQGSVLSGGQDTIVSLTGTLFSPVLAAGTARPEVLAFHVEMNNAIAETTYLTNDLRTAPSVTASPSSRTIHPFKSVSFSASAVGFPSPDVQWERSDDGGATWTAIPDATARTLTVTATPGDSGSRFRARFTNGIVPDALTAAATLTVRDAGGTDLDGDGAGDLTVWRPDSGTWFSLTSSSGYDYAQARGVQWGNAGLGDVPLLGDIDGDTIPDLVVWRASTGTWYWITSSTGYDTGLAGSQQWGNSDLGDQPFLADMDGDDKMDLVVWRASTGTWYWLTSTSGYDVAVAAGIQWGSQAEGDTPFVADIDGDGLGDLIVWRPSSGTWFWLTSSSGYNTAAAEARQWGNLDAGDVPLIGDFDGDRKADLAVWRAPSGTWFWLTSSTGYDYASAGALQWGNESLGDRPFLTDMDGDGRADLTVWRASSGTWFWLKSTTGYSYAASGARQWGSQSAGDIPMVR
jgi:hypothetical protein